MPLRRCSRMSQRALNAPPHASCTSAVKTARGHHGNDDSLSALRSGDRRRGTGVPRMRPHSQGTLDCRTAPRPERPWAFASSAATPSARSAIRRRDASRLCRHGAIPGHRGLGPDLHDVRRVEADLIKENLQSEGVDAAVLSQKDRSFNVELGDLSPVRVLVPAYDYSEPCSVLGQHMDGAGEVVFACPSCGEAFEPGTPCAAIVRHTAPDTGRLIPAAVRTGQGHAGSKAALEPGRDPRSGLSRGVCCGNFHCCHTRLTGQPEPAAPSPARGSWFASPQSHPTALHPISSWRSAAASCASTASWSVTPSTTASWKWTARWSWRWRRRAAAGPTIYEIEKDAGEPLGIVPAADAVRQCANKCVFCFIDGNPEDARQSLHLKDDDFRLSFTYGSYVTLTNLGERVPAAHRPAPLAAVRERARHGAGSADAAAGRAAGRRDRGAAARLTAAGLEVHTQVVLCPEWNDGAHLDRTIDDLWSLGPGVLSLSVVPVGLTQYNINRPVRLLTRGGGGRRAGQVDAARERAHAERGTAGRTPATRCTSSPAAVPAASLLRRLAADGERRGRGAHAAGRFDAGLPSVPPFAGPAHRDRDGHADGAGVRAAGARLPRTRARTSRWSAVRTHVRPDGEHGGPAAGCATSRRRARARVAAAFDLVLLPAESLNDDDVFIDNMPLTNSERQLAPARCMAGARAHLRPGGMS
jgi:hypothetical protein